MTQPALAFDAPQTKLIGGCDRLAAHFKAHPHQWLPMYELAYIGGLGGFRTRISELRFSPWSMNIQNRTDSVVTDDGRHRKHSYYRYLPEAH